MRFLFSLLIVAICGPSFAQCTSRGCNISGFHRHQAVKVIPQREIIVQQAEDRIFILNNIPQLPYGSVQYSSQYPELSLIDVDELAAQALLLQKASVSSQEEYQRNTLSFIERLVEIQKPIAEIIARGQAVSRIIDSAQLEAIASTSTQGSIDDSLLSQACGKCHAVENPKGGFDLTDQNFDVALAVSRIADGTMPPDGLDPADSLLLINELVTEVRK